MTGTQIEAQCCNPENGGGYTQALSSEESCFMGIDTGASARTRRAYIGRIENGIFKILKLWRYKDLKDIAKNIELFHVKQGVIDAGGEPTFAKELVAMFPRIFYRCVFRTGEIAGKWNEKTGIVNIDRVAALDASREALYSKTVLPNRDDEDVQIFCSENGALVRTEAQGTKGSTLVKYVSHGPDHGGLTWTYLLMAMTRPSRDSTAKAVGPIDGKAKVDTVLRRRGLR